MDWNNLSLLLFLNRTNSINFKNLQDDFKNLTYRAFPNITKSINYNFLQDDFKKLSYSWRLVYEFINDPYQTSPTMTRMVGHNATDIMTWWNPNRSPIFSWKEKYFCSSILHLEVVILQSIFLFLQSCDSTDHSFWKNSLDLKIALSKQVFSGWSYSCDYW